VPPARFAAGFRASAAAFLALALSVVSATSARADTRDQIAQLRAEIDRAAEAYFDAERAQNELDAAIAAMEGRLRRVGAGLGRLRTEARDRAVELYTGAGVTANVSDTASALDAARQVAFMASANEHATATIERYAAVQDDYSETLAVLQQRRSEQRQVLADLRARQDALDAALDRARTDLAAEIAAERAAAERARVEALAATATTEGSSATTAGAPGTTDGPSSSQPPTSGEAPTTTTTRPPTTTTNPPPPDNPSVHPHHDDPFLSCVRQRESRGVYTAVNPAGYYGAYQFHPRTWDATAAHAGRLELVGVRPDHAGVFDQDDMAWTLYQWQGSGPWGGHCP
jgi:hypothetical protein